MKIFGLEIKKAEAPIADLLYELYMRQVYRLINRGVPVPIADNPTSYILNGYAGNPLVYAAVSLRATTAKGIPWLVYKVKNKQKLKLYKSLDTRYNNILELHRAIQIKEQSLDEVEGTPLNLLFDKPNHRDTFQDLIEQMFVYRDCTGNAYLYAIKNPVTKKVTSLYGLPSDKVKIIGGTFIDPIEGYVVQDMFDDVLAPDNVIHWHTINPIWQSDGRWLYGMSPLRPVASIIAQENMAIQGQSAAFMNEGLKGIITGTEQTDIEFSKEQAKILEENFKKKSGYKNNKNIAFNRAPLNFLKIGESPVDLGVNEARKINKELICNVFKIHPALLSSEASTLDNLKEARKSLVTTSVLPDLDSLKAQFNENIAKSYGDDYYVDYDLMAISELQDDLESLGRTLKDMDWITDNEKRSATQYDRYDNEAADKLYKDMGKMPIGEDIDTGFTEIDKQLNR